MRISSGLAGQPPKASCTTLQAAQGPDVGFVAASRIQSTKASGFNSEASCVMEFRLGDCSKHGVFRVLPHAT